MAEGEGFEPPLRFPVKRFSRPSVSTAHTTLRGERWPASSIVRCRLSVLSIVLALLFTSSLDHQVGNIHLLFAEGANECRDDFRIELVPRSAFQDFARLILCAPLAVWTIARDRIVGVPHGEDARFQRNLFPRAIAVAGA